MRRWWHRSLARQMVGVLLIALLVTQVLGFALSWRGRIAALTEAAHGEFVSRTASLVEVVATMPAAQRREVLLASATSHSRYWTTEDNPQDTGREWYVQSRIYLLAPLADITQFRLSPTPPELTEAERRVIDSKTFPLWQPFTSPLWPAARPALSFRFEPGIGMGLITPLPDGSWLNAVFYKREQVDTGLRYSLISTLAMAVVLCGLGIFAARRITQPLRHLARTADALGRGEAPPAAPPSGPEDIREVQRAFVEMQARLHRFVQDRTRMLAAIGHDLRTPLTTLRLRAEFIEDEDLRQRMTDTLDEMQRMTEATLTFARGVEVQEPTRTVDLSALLSSICDDLAELGLPVHWADCAPLPLRCRPDALRRAFRNVIENAVSYGGSAEVSLTSTEALAEVTIRDRGPGVPSHLLEEVFQPFFRADAARSPAKGSVGLGLSIARASAREHGGDLRLEPAAPGLRAIFTLPRGPAPLS